jgi:hypothetical protein
MRRTSQRGRGQPRDIPREPVEQPRQSFVTSPHDQGDHLPTVKVGFQKLRGQRKTEMKY